MKKYLILLLLALPFAVNAQTLAMVPDSGRYNTQYFKGDVIGYSVAQPRFRISRSASLALTTSWQTIDFSGTSIYNNNTFPIDPASGLQQVSWDNVNKLVKFNMPFDVNHMVTFYGATTTNLVTTRASIQLRFRVPNGISPGVDLFFPFPDYAGYVDLWEVTLLAAVSLQRDHLFSVYINNQIRANGFQIQARLSNSLIVLGTCTLDNAALLINSTNSIN